MGTTAPVRVPKPWVACPVCTAWVEQLHSDRAPWCGSCAEQRKRCPDLDPDYFVASSTVTLLKLPWQHIEPLSFPCSGCGGLLFVVQSEGFPYSRWRLHSFPEGGVYVASLDGPGRRVDEPTLICSWCGVQAMVEPCPRCRYGGRDA